MGSETEILKIIPTIHAVSLLKKIAKKKRNIAGDAIDILVGSSLIKTEADIINSI